MKKLSNRELTAELPFSNDAATSLKSCVEEYAARLAAGAQQVARARHEDGVSVADIVLSSVSLSASPPRRSLRKYLKVVGGILLGSPATLTLEALIVGAPLAPRVLAFCVFFAVAGALLIRSD